MAQTETPLVVRRTINARPGRVFAAWTRPDLMQKWLAPGPCSVVEAKNDLRVGGAFRVVLQDDSGGRHTITGVYETIEPDRRLSMTWRYCGPIDFLDGMETLLEVDLGMAGSERTEMILTQRRIATKQARDAFDADWPTCFDKLERTVEEALH